MSDLVALTKQLQSLEEKVLHLIASREVLKAQLKEVDKDNQELQEMVEKQAEEIKSLQKKLTDKTNRFHNQDKISKIVKFTFADEGKLSGLKEKLDEYIREIDQCISLLSK